MGLCYVLVDTQSEREETSCATFLLKHCPNLYYYIMFFALPGTVGHLTFTRLIPKESRSFSSSADDSQSFWQIFSEDIHQNITVSFFSHISQLSLVVESSRS